MSNESVQTHLAIPAQSIAQAGKPVIRPKSEYTEFFSQYCRAGYGVAKLFSYLVLRNQRNKPGDNPARLEVQREGGRWGTRGYWWLDTLKEMADVCHISVKQVRTALDILERLNQIEAHQGRHSINGVVPKYRGKSVLHIRLTFCERGNGIDCWPTVEQMRIVLECPKGHLIACPQGHSLLPDALEVLDSLEVKNSNKGFLSENPTAVIHEPQQATSESQESKATPIPFGALLEVPKIGKKKTKVATQNGDWQHYNRLAQTHDMNQLLQACIDAGAVGASRKMLDDDECSFLDHIEHGLKTSPWDDEDTLESLLAIAKDWPLCCDMFESVEQKDLVSPASFSWTFFTKHVLIFLADPEIDPQPAAPLVSSAIAQVDQVTSAPCTDYDDEGYTYQEKLDAMRHAAMLEVNKLTTPPALPPPNMMFQNKTKHVQAA